MQRINIFELCLIFLILFLPQGLASDKINATIEDISGTSTYISGIYLYWEGGMYYDTYSSFSISVGDASINVPFKNAKIMQFNWSLTPPSINITSTSGEMINGVPKSVDGYYFKGETSFGKFSLPVINTSLIKFDETLPQNT